MKIKTNSKYVKKNDIFICIHDEFEDRHKYIDDIKNASAIIKGLRAVTDFEYEFQMSLTNKKINDELETVFLTTNSEYMYLSSSVVKEIAKFGGDISDFVPEAVLNDIEKRIKNRKEQ